MKWTGERLVTEMGALWGTIEHLHRYALAMEICRGQIVLDIASGEGYGSNLLASVANQVHGVDISAEAIAHSQVKYKRDNLSFIKGSLEAMPLPDQCIDVVVSFETLEHYARHEEMFMEFKRVLKPKGQLLLSSPEKSIYYQRDPDNSYHVKELTLAELKGLVSRHFRYAQFFSQRQVIGTLINIEDEHAYGYRLYDGDFLGIRKRLDEHQSFNQPFFNLVMCSDEELLFDQLPGCTFFSACRVYDGIIEELENANRAILNSRSYRTSRLFARALGATKRIVLRREGG